MKARIHWRVCGPKLRDRVGGVSGDLGLPVRIDWCAKKQVYRVMADGVARGAFDDIEAAKAFAAENVAAWLEQAQTERDARTAQDRERRASDAAVSARIEAVVATLSNHGIVVRTLGGIFLRVDAAEKLVATLEDLTARAGDRP